MRWVGHRQKESPVLQERLPPFKTNPKIVTLDTLRGRETLPRLTSLFTMSPGFLPPSTPPVPPRRLALLSSLAADDVPLEESFGECPLLAFETYRHLPPPTIARGTDREITPSLPSPIPLFPFGPPSFPPLKKIRLLFLSLGM